MQVQADLLFSGGRVYTADRGRPWAEAVAVAGGRILAVGQAGELAELRGPRTVEVDLAGKLLAPAFTDSHIHFIDVALRGARIDATGARSASDVVELVRQAVKRTPPGAWILGGGFDANTWAGGPQPHRRLLDAVAPDHPVLLDSKELHAAWANSAALERAGIGPGSAEVSGGVIDREADGTPTGLLRDRAIELMRAARPAPTLAETSAAVKAATPGLWAQGIAAIHNAVITHDTLALPTYQLLHSRGELGVRVLQHLPLDVLDEARALGLRSGFGDEWLRIGSIKMFADGALGSRTASMLQPFSGEPDNWGVQVTDPEELLEKALAASAAGLSCAIHAIGDRANRDVLNVLAEVRGRETGVVPESRPALRHRIEHVQCITAADLPRLAQLDVIASVQPIHCTSDMQIVDRYWGPERAGQAYPFRSLLDSGARLAFGSDAPVEAYSPLMGIYAAVTRRRADGMPGPDGWHGEQRLALAEAIDAYTIWPADAAGEAGYRGSITPGKVADLVVLDRDLFAGDGAALAECRVAMTVINGRAVYTRD